MINSFRSRLLIRGLILIGFLFLLNSYAWADVVWVKGNRQPIFGRVVSLNSSELVFEERVNNGSYRKTKFQLADIELHRNIRPEDLLRLDGRNWRTYRDLAEELATQKADPVAHEMAIRLFVIAAANDRGEIGLSSLIGLVNAARNPVELEKFQRLLSLHADPMRTNIFDRRSNSIEPTADIERGRSDLLEVVQLLRKNELKNDNGKSVGQLLNDPSVQLGIKSLELENVRGRLLQIATVTRPNARELQFLVELESALRYNVESGRSVSRTMDWSNAAHLPASRWSALPRIDQATEFDPLETIWRNGQWQRPKDLP